MIFKKFEKFLKSLIKITFMLTNKASYVQVNNFDNLIA